MIKIKTIAEGKCFGLPSRQRESLVQFCWPQPLSSTSERRFRPQFESGLTGDGRGRLEYVSWKMHSVVIIMRGGHPFLAKIFTSQNSTFVRKSAGLLANTPNTCKNMADLPMICIRFIKSKSIGSLSDNKSIYSYTKVPKTIKLLIPFETSQTLLILGR